MKLEQQRVLIVGGTSGFGKAVARQALQAGAQVHIIGHQQAHVDTTIAQLRSLGAIKGTALDAQSEAALTAFF